MSFRPRIAIPVPTSFDSSYNDQSWPEYARAVQASGGDPARIELGQNPAALLAAAAQCHGVLLPGSGADVNPARYGHASEPETAPPDETREIADRLLLEAVERDRKPLLAICFGLQSLNIYRGGTLVQHLLPVPVNHRAGRAVTAAHALQISGESALASIVLQNSATRTSTKSERLLVNSSHHQAVGIAGDGLSITARSVEDGVIEALEDSAYPWLVGVQWHPERTMDTSPASRAVFASFLSAAGATR